ncbi:MAG: ATP-binding cassette domain-containing protein, partial [Rhodospirillales bacterium]
IPRAEPFGAVVGPASVRGAGWELAAAGVVRAVLWLALPMLMLQVFDRALPAARADDLIVLAAAVAAALAVRAVLDLAAAALVETTAQAQGRAGGWTAIDGLFSGASSDVPANDVAAPAPHMLILTGLPVLAVVLVYLAGAIAVPAIFLAVAAAGAGHVIHRGGMRTAPADGIAERILDVLWTVKAMGAENLVLRRAEGAARDAAATDRSRVRPLFAAGRAMTLFDRVTLVLVILTGTVLCLNGLITVGQLAAGVLISQTLVRDAFRGTAAWTLMRAGRDTKDAAAPTDGPQEPLPRVTGNLMVNRVSLDQPADGLRAVARSLFDRVRIEAEVGEMILITGGDAQMQSALLRLMAGLERPQSGTVTVDGYDLAAYRPDSIRRQVAYVPNLGNILPGSLLENLTGFDAGRAADALGAARLTGLDARAACLADGFDTRLQGGAAGFPAGFRQHVAVTRALAFKPKILLLDRATENLDSRDLRTFSEVLERLKGRVTIVFASTQAGLRAMADREIDLDSLKPAPEIGAAGDEDDAGAAPFPNPDGEG